MNAVQARADAIAPFAAAADAARVAAGTAADELAAAKSVVTNAQASLDAAQAAVEQTAAELAAAQERADHLGYLAADSAAGSSPAFAASWEAGTFGNEWVSANAADMEATLAQKRAAYDQALAAKQAAEQQLVGAKENLAVKQAAYDKAAAALAQAKAELADAQAWYDRMHPAPEPQAATLETPGDQAIDEKVANAKHVAKADGDGSALAQTGDSVGEMFWIGGVAFVAVGVAIGASAASRRRSSAE